MGVISEDLTNHESSDYNPSWSPDGKRIAFTSFRNGRKWDIYVMDADGDNQRRLTNHPDGDWNPSWSPDGKRIAFVSNRTRDLNPDIYVMDADGSNPRNLTNHPDDDEAPAWLNSCSFSCSRRLRPSQCGDGSSRLTDNCHYSANSLC